MNTLQNQIINLIQSARNSVKIAVSWFTDEQILECLIAKSATCNVSVLLSADELNIYRHDFFKRLIANGANVKKIGSNSALDGNFMHNKYILVDNHSAYGGSYNFTRNARSNYESFKKWDRSEVCSTVSDFDALMKSAKYFFSDITSIEEILKTLRDKFSEEQLKRNMTLKRISELDFVESCIKTRENYAGKANSLRTSAQALTNQDKIVSGSAIVSSSYSNSNVSVHSKSSTGGTIAAGTGSVVKKHRFHGGSAFLSIPQKKSNTYALSYYQKYNIDKMYNSFKTRIENDALICTGKLQPTPECDTYKVQIEFIPGMSPSVYIKSPKIKVSHQTHVYNEGCLCLYDPMELKWKDTFKLAEYTIPWTIEWILYYELWKLSGKWEGPESLN